jgi:hypothetical protein
MLKNILDNYFNLNGNQLLATISSSIYLTIHLNLLIFEKIIEPIKHKSSEYERNIM